MADTPNSYRFVTTWKLQAPCRVVWEELNDSIQWPRWWRGVLSSRQLPPKPGMAADQKVGQRNAFSMVAPMGYVVKFEMEILEWDAPFKLVARASGDFTGIGEWVLTHHDGYTTATYHWNVQTNKRWMRWMEPLLRRSFVKNHNKIMQQGLIGLCARIGCKGELVVEEFTMAPTSATTTNTRPEVKVESVGV